VRSDLSIVLARPDVETTMSTWHERWEARRQQHRAEHDRAAYETARARWQSEVDELTGMLEDTSASGTTDVDGLVLKRNESAFAVVEGAALVEARRGKGHYEGASQGFSFRIAKGVRYHVGANRGTFVAGEERPTIIDEGTVYVTNQRVAFAGPKQTREWAFTKLISVDHARDVPLTMLSVSNRQKTSGFGYSDAVQTMVRFRLDLALAHFRGTVDELQDSLRAAIADQQALKPAEPATTSPALPPPAE
jgi:hypothetical protein